MISSEPNGALHNTIRDIEDWAEDRNLIAGSKPKDQLAKLMEEVGELAAAIARGKGPDEISDAIGDCIVVLTILARQNNVFIDNAIAYAYEVIKDRKGKMIDGVFVKEGE